MGHNRKRRRRVNMKILLPLFLFGFIIAVQGGMPGAKNFDNGHLVKCGVEADSNKWVKEKYCEDCGGRDRCHNDCQWHNGVCRDRERTVKGKLCTDKCARRGESYNWCHKPVT